MEQFEDRFPPYYFWRDGGGEFQEYYDGRYVAAGYYAPLTHSLALTNGTGSPTLTRATAMWEFDNEGKMITVPASAAAFGGARMVRNVLASGSTEDFTNIAWSKGGTTATPSANTINFPAANDSIFQPFTTSNAVPGSAWCGSVTLSGTGNVSLEVKRGGGGTFESTSSLITLTSTPTRHQVTHTFANSGHTSIQIVLTRPASGGATSVTATMSQLENITGQAILTANEYVAGDQGAGVNNLKWFNTHKDGTPIPASSLLGLATNEAAVTNTMLYCRDFTNAAWVATNVTPAKTRTGLDNASNSCSLLTATAANATILQTITAAASAGCTGFYVKRSAGTGTISITRDGGSTWTDITSLINSTTFTKVKIENTSVTNPSVGFKIGTSGDAIIVDGGINHLGTKIYHLPILTTSAAVTVQSQTLTYPKTSNIIDADGTVMATVTADDWAGIDGGVVGSTTRGLFATATGASAKDGTNTPTGAADTPSGTVKIGMKYTTDFMRAMSDAGFGTATDYTGTLATDLTNIGIGSGFTGHIKEVAVWQEVISDYKMRNMP